MYRMPLSEQDSEQQFDRKLLSIVETIIVPRIGDPRVGDTVIVSLHFTSFSCLSWSTSLLSDDSMSVS